MPISPRYRETKKTFYQKKYYKVAGTTYTYYLRWYLYYDYYENLTGNLKPDAKSHE